MDLDARENEATFTARLKQIVSDYGSANSLATKIGRSEGAVRNWLSGKSEPGVSDLVAMCRETRTRVEWLVIGRGPRVEPDISGVREGAGHYFLGGPPEEKLLTSIAEAIEQELSVQTISLAPAKKAALIVNCYHFIGSIEKFDTATVVRLLKLAT